MSRTAVVASSPIRRVHLLIGPTAPARLMARRQ
jgi:hypothetical protein